ncbi:MAG: TilS substrate-binding domain-containing protein, partial [Demequinaceae bacterium]|nr:TilS substrate-binding domain-containing protein [Demequinaceae bacterium]
GMSTVFVEKVKVGREGGLEAAARAARYEAIERRVIAEGGLNPHVLLGHTMDDQAETVLLALARGSGARALSGMSPRRGSILRPFLGLRRSDTVAVCEVMGLAPWLDPTTEPDGGSKRSALRGKVMPTLVDVLGPGVIPGLARSAALLQADADELDRQARAALHTSAPVDAWPVEMLSSLPEAIRGRILKMLAERMGAGPLTLAHVRAIDQLVMNYRGQGSVSLPGGFEARREYGRLVVVGPEDLRRQETGRRKTWPRTSMGLWRPRRRSLPPSTALPGRSARTIRIPRRSSWSEC